MRLPLVASPPVSGRTSVRRRRRAPHGRARYPVRVDDPWGWLTLAQWLAVLRIGVGLWWLESVRHKPLRSFLRGSSMGWVESLTQDHPLPWFARTIQRVSLGSERRRVVTSWLVVGGEFLVGLSLALGLLTPLGALGGIFLNSNYLLLAGLKDQGEQGQNLMMILIEVVVLGSGAGGAWSLDSFLF